MLQTTLRQFACSQKPSNNLIHSKTSQDNQIFRVGRITANHIEVPQVHSEDGRTIQIRQTAEDVCCRSKQAPRGSSTNRTLKQIWRAPGWDGTKKCGPSTSSNACQRICFIQNCLHLAKECQALQCLVHVCMFVCNGSQYAEVLNMGKHRFHLPLLQGLCSHHSDLQEGAAAKWSPQLPWNWPWQSPE